MLQHGLILATLTTMWCACEGVTLVTPPSSRSVVSVRFRGGRVSELRVAPVGAYAPAFGLSLSDRRRSCEDLCGAGLGGEPCGGICDDLLPTVFRKETLNESSKALEASENPKRGWKFPFLNHEKEDKNNETETEPGRPRIDVCPVLCKNNLGAPLCGCKSTERTADWSLVCNSFCKSDSYVLPGCPECSEYYEEEILDKMTMMMPQERMDEVWIEWCRSQCKKGQGGAACNCDLFPFRKNQDEVSSLNDSKVA